MKVKDDLVKSVLKRYTEQKKRAETEKLRNEIKVLINESIQNWRQYQGNIDMVSEDDLICYFSYMMKAEESRLSYLHKQLP